MKLPSEGQINKTMRATGMEYEQALDAVYTRVVLQDKARRNSKQHDNEYSRARIAQRRNTMREYE
jgi:hypothetical protein